MQHHRAIGSFVGFVCCALGASCSKSTPSGTAPSATTSSSAAPAASASAHAELALTSKAFALPGVSGPVTLDLIAYDRARGQIWIPVGEGGSVHVFTIATSSFSRVDGFKTKAREARGRTRMMGPSAAAVGDGYVYVSDRASNEVCAVSDTTLKVGACVPLTSPPDVIGYDAASKEIWVTTPKETSITVLDATTPDQPKPKTVIKTDGEPECYAFDDQRGLFYTNLEDKNRIVSIDMKAHAVKASYALGCSEEGPRGVAVDSQRNLLFVACADHVEVVDGGGKFLGKLDAGAGVDAIEYASDTKKLYVAAGKSGRLTIATFSNAGAPTIVAKGETAPSARNAVVDSSGNAYVVDSQNAKLLVVSAP